MPPIVQHRRGTLASLTAANETPNAGEIYFETDTNKLKVGDGVTAYNALPYVVGGSGGGGGGGSANNRTLGALAFNGTATTFGLTIDSTPVTPANAASLLIVLNGVVQQPEIAYTVDGSNITFSTAPASTDTFYGVFLAGAAASFWSPTQITANQNNYALPIGTTHVRLSADAARTITGFVAATGTEVALHNVGSFPITLAHQSSSSSAANRILSSLGTDIALQPNESVTITYDATTARWRTAPSGTQAAAAWWAASSDKAKLDNIAAGATANATDAQLRDRATHTGVQAISTVDGLQAALDSKQAAGSYASATHTHTISSVAGLQSALDGKQASGSYAALVHAHAIADVAGLQTALNSFAAATHTHQISAISGLQAALDSKQTAGVYATLVDGKVPASQLPSFVDDVIEVDNFSLLPPSGEEGKIYVTINNGKAYRWAGSTYVEIVASPGSTDVIAEGSTNLYFTNTRAVAAVTWTTLTGKPTFSAVATSGSYTDLTNKPTLFSGAYADLTGKPALFDGAYTSLTNVPATFAPSIHQHAVGDVAGLQTALDGKAALSHTHSASAITDFSTAVAAASPEEVVEFLTTADFPATGNSSLLYIATDNARAYRWVGSQYAEVGPTSLFMQGHTHAASDIVSGTVAAARLGNGSPSSANYLRGDGTWVAAPVTSVDGNTGAVTVTKSEIYDFYVGSKPASASGSNGSYTWSIPSTAKYVTFYCHGAGAGGGSGRRGAAGTARCGGGGGGAGGWSELTYSVAELPSLSCAVNVVSGGAGGAAITTDNTDGNVGTHTSATTNVTVGSRMVCAGWGASRGSGGGSAASAAGGDNWWVSLWSPNGAASAGRSGAAGDSSAQVSYTASRGGGGGGIDASNNQYAGGAGGNAPTIFGATAGPTGGTAGGGNGSNGTAWAKVGGGGAGGGGNASGAGGDGGNGAFPGGGGGGGGASTNGSPSGKGGNGGDGFVRITVWY